MAKNSEQKTSPAPPLLSVVAPVYRTEKYLEATVESLLSQTFRDMEVILVDDRSPDGAPAICDRYAALDPRVRVIHKDANEGLGMARNTGIDAARGKYIAFVDTDDILHPDTYAEAVGLMEQSGADMVRFTCNRFTDSGQSSPQCYEGEPRTFDTPEDIHRLALCIFDVPTVEMETYDLGGSSCMAIYRLDMIRRHGIRFESEREYLSEDYLFNFDYYNRSRKVVYLPRTYYHYRITEGSLTRRLQLGVMDRVAHYCDHVVEKMRASGCPPEDLSYAAGFYIGALRANMRFVFLSRDLSIGQKCEWFRRRTSDPFFRRECRDYPWRKLPAKRRILFRAMWKKRFFISWALIIGFSKLRRDKLK